MIDQAKNRQDCFRQPLPALANVYFDFYSRELHNYRISGAVTWSEAIVESYISDAEDPAETLE